MFKIDGIEFTKAVLSKPKRSFQVLDSELTNRLLIGDMFRDVVGTFYNYSVVLDSSFMTQEEYDELYEIISAPVPFHTMVVPYGQSTYEYQAYVTNGTDEIPLIKPDKNYFNNLTFNFIAKSPKRRPGD
jgi:hypothetical protein